MRLLIATLLLALMPSIASADGCIDESIYTPMLLRLGYTPDVRGIASDGNRIEVWKGPHGAVIVTVTDGTACWRGRFLAWQIAKKRDA